MTHDLENTKRLLGTIGYRTFFRQNEWWECLLVSDDERWTGLGTDQQEALEDAMRRALPSRLARWLFDQLSRTEAANETTGLIVLPPTRGSNPPNASLPATIRVPADAPLPSNVVLFEPRAQAAAQAAQAALDGAPPPEAAPAALDAPPQAPAPSPTVETPKPAAAAETHEAPRVASRAEDTARPPTAREVLDEIKSMQRQIKVDAEELALASPRRQRLVLLGWIARARAAQSAYPDEARIDAAVATIARVLTGYCQTWWPGSVRSLKVTTRPEDIVVDLTMPVDRPPSSWQEACELIERNVRLVEEDDEAKNRDGHGWADASRLHPPPRDAEAMLSEIIKEVEALSGPIGSPATKPELPEPTRFVEWARKLRWARETTEDPARWGSLNGRFRFWVRENHQKFSEAARTLEAEWSPDRSWAALLGLDPETIQRNRDIRELFASPPTADQEITDEALRAWIARALTYSDTHLAPMVSAMRAFRDRVLAIDADSLPGADRRMRRRFAKLQKEVAAPTPSQIPPPLEPIPQEAPESASDPMPEGGALAAALREPILRYTRGKRALFVSNRADPNLRQRLKDLFEFDDLEWSQGETKRRQSLLGPIQSGSYNYVLGATGFLSHSIDGQISIACRKGEVPYVRVHRGRPLACLRAMARELGLGENSNSPATLDD